MPKAAPLAATFNPPASIGLLAFTMERNSTNFTARSSRRGSTSTLERRVMGTRSDWIPRGIQSDLVPITLRSKVEVDPLRDDLAVKLVELRSMVKAKSPMLAGGLKVAANGAAFGILCQMDVKDLDSPSRLRVFSGEMTYTTPPSKVWEQPAEFCCPVIASLVTGGSHLLCAMLERTVRDLGGQIAAMDTRSEER